MGKLDDVLATRSLSNMLPALCLALLWTQAAHAQTAVGDALTTARAQDGSYISWRERIIDEAASAGFALSGSDGLVMADGDIDFVGTRGNSAPYDGTRAERVPSYRRACSRPTRAAGRRRCPR